ncbi:unnamed protein product [Rotaria sp. Silwood1]|nr:unnamed protein product [Rotaria sp. Silwood1]
MTIGTGKFERMTKEEKLRFCRDLIKKAANLTKSSAVSDIYSTGNTSSHSDIYSKSKSNQQPSSVSDTLLKETKNDTLINNGTSKLHPTKRTTSRSSIKSSTSYTIASTVLSPSKRSATANKTNVTNIKSKSKSNTKSEKTTGNHQTKQSHKTNKDRTETCTVQFVPKFNPNSNTNQVPIYRLVRHAFGNMVREAICQLDKDKTGVSSQQIIDHIVKHYAFPNNVSESVVRNRAMFTINSGLRAGTLLTVNPNKGVRIGRMRHNYARMLC